MGEPPSSSGGFQDNVQVSGVISYTSRGPTGGDGLSTTKTWKKTKLLNVLLSKTS